MKSFMGYGSDSIRRKSGFRVDCLHSGFIQWLVGGEVPALDYLQIVVNDDRDGGIGGDGVGPGPLAIGQIET